MGTKEGGAVGDKICILFLSHTFFGERRFELEESMDLRCKLPQASCPESKRICGFVKGRQRKGLEFVP